MPDFADDADDFREAHLASALARVSPAIPVGVAGECGDCGEHMPRLVGGRCGFCRDGRRPPADQYPSVTNPRPKEIIVANPPPSADRRQISFPATGAVLAAIMARVSEGASISTATMELLERGLAPAVAPAVEASGLAGFDTDQLLDELRDRASGGAYVRDLEADLAEANARRATAESKVEAAEARLARVGAILAGGN